eukprot:1160661-Pelagomonas_calceolata.AAC.6
MEDETMWVTVLCWLVAATILGDYKYVRPESDDWYQNLLGPVYIAVLNATLTWGLSALMSLAIFRERSHWLLSLFLPLPNKASEVTMRAYDRCALTGLTLFMSLRTQPVYMLSANLLAAAPLLSDIRTEDTSPQLEVVSLQSYLIGSSCIMRT